MKKISTLIFALVLICSLSFAQKKGQKAEKTGGSKIELKTSMDTISYSFGADLFNYFQNLEQFNTKMNLDLLMKGITDVFTDKRPLLTVDQQTRILTEFVTAMKEKQKVVQEKLRKEIGEKNLKEGAFFLSENIKKDSIKVTASGLQYKIIKEGKGKKPTVNDTVTVHWTGKTYDGKEFVNSYLKGEPMVFALSNQFDGLKEALQLMSEGSSYQFFMPSNLGFGEMGEGPVEPNAVLVFEINLIKIN
jgi:FKBP-type peptidyl-prolyl cis-trans isomerase FklB